MYLYDLFYCIRYCVLAPLVLVRHSLLVISCCVRCQKSICLTSLTSQLVPAPIKPRILLILNQTRGIYTVYMYICQLHTILCTICLYVYVCVSVRPSVYLPACLPSCLPVSVYTCVCMQFSVFVHMDVSVYIYAIMGIRVCTCVCYVCICLFVYMYMRY